MQCWYWATLGVGSVVAQTANAAAVIARRIGFSLFQAFPSASKSAQVHGRIQATRVLIRHKHPLLTIPRSPSQDLGGTLTTSCNSGTRLEPGPQAVTRSCTGAEKAIFPA